MAEDAQEQPVEGEAQQGSRARSSQVVKEHLLASAVSVFGEQGFEKARVSDVARRCGMTTGAVFSRWPIKVDLFCAAVESVSPKTFVVTVAESDMPTSDKIAALGECLLTTERATHRDLLLEARAIARRNPEIRSRLADAFRSEADAIARIVEDGRSVGDMDIAVGAFVLFSQALDLGTHLAAATNPEDGPQMSAADWNELIRRVTTAMQPAGRPT